MAKRFFSLEDDEQEEKLIEESELQYIRDEDAVDRGCVELEDGLTAHADATTGVLYCCRLAQGLGDEPSPVAQKMASIGVEALLNRLHVKGRTRQAMESATVYVNAQQALEIAERVLRALKDFLVWVFNLLRTLMRKFMDFIRGIFNRLKEEELERFNALVARVEYLDTLAGIDTWNPNIKPAENITNLEAFIKAAKSLAEHEFEKAREGVEHVRNYMKNQTPIPEAWKASLGEVSQPAKVINAVKDSLPLKIRMTKDLTAIESSESYNAPTFKTPQNEKEETAFQKAFTSSLKDIIADMAGVEQLLSDVERARGNIPHPNGEGDTTVITEAVALIQSCYGNLQKSIAVTIEVCQAGIKGAHEYRRISRTAKRYFDKDGNEIRTWSK